MSTEVKYINEKKHTIVVNTTFRQECCYAPEGTSGGILKSHRPSVRPSVTNRVRGSVIAHKLLKEI